MSWPWNNYLLDNMDHLHIAVYHCTKFSLKFSTLTGYTLAYWPTYQCVQSNTSNHLRKSIKLLKWLTCKFFAHWFCRERCWFCYGCLLYGRQTLYVWNFVVVYKVIVFLCLLQRPLNTTLFVLECEGNSSTTLCRWQQLVWFLEDQSQHCICWKRLLYI